MPPLVLPKKEFMENAHALWERLGLPVLKPETPEKKERRRSQHARAHRGGQGQWLRPARRRA
jgi:hypothetical protein